MSSHLVSYAQKRRSTRIDQAIPLLVQGVGALREPYQEQVSTLSISCHGCTYQSKHEVIQGETVYLDIKPPSDGSVAYSSKARVKWSQKLASKERAYQIAVELEIAGNVWGVPTPPSDWFPPQIVEAVEAATPGRELKVVSRKEQPAAPAPVAAQLAVQDRGPQLQKLSPSATVSGPMAMLMVGLGEQIQTMASEAAAEALVKEKSRLLEEFREQLREEAVNAIHSAISSSKEEITRQAMQELRQAQEAAAQISHAQWRKKIEQDLESARQHMLVKGKEAHQQLETMAASAIERVQTRMDTTRSEAVERFVARIRDQVAPMLEVAKDSLQKLEGAELALRKESEAIFAGLENELAQSTNQSLAKAQEDLQKNTVAITIQANEGLQKLYQDFERAAKFHVESLLAASQGQIANSLREKAVQVSREFASGLEGYTRNYLDSIGKSIAEISPKVPSRS